MRFYTRIAVVATCSVILVGLAVFSGRFATSNDVAVGTEGGSSVAGGNAELVEKAREVMHRPDRSLYLAEVCASKRSAVRPSSESVVPTLAPTTHSSMGLGYGVVAFDGPGSAGAAGNGSGGLGQDVAMQNQALRESEIRRYGQGGCMDENIREAEALRLSQEFGGLVQRIVRDVRVRPEVEAGWQLWRECMAAEGYAFESQRSIVQSLVAEHDALGYVAADASAVAEFDRAVADLAERELAISARDAECYAEHVAKAESTAIEHVVTTLAAQDIDLLRKVADLVQ